MADLPRPSHSCGFTSWLGFGALALCLCAQSAWAANLRVAWDSSDDPATRGYVVYVGATTGSYESTYDVGPSLYVDLGEATQIGRAHV